MNPYVSVILTIAVCLLLFVLWIIYENYKNTQIPEKNLKMLAGLFAIYKVSYEELHEILRVIHCYKADARKLDEMTIAGIPSEMLEKLLPGLTQPSGSTISIKKVRLV